MPKIYVANHVTLDGVMQGPGRTDEDTRDDFAAGGWSAANMDSTLTEALSSRVSLGGGMRLLLGRRSYEGMLGYWNTQDGPFKEGLNGAQKFVVSTTLVEPLPWPNSILVSGDVATEVAKLKDAAGADLCVMGSGQLIQSLMAHHLVDEFLLFIHPVVLGSGRRCFPTGGSAGQLRLLGSSPTSTGVIIAHYQAK